MSIPFKAGLALQQDPTQPSGGPWNQPEALAYGCLQANWQSWQIEGGVSKAGVIKASGLTLVFPALLMSPMRSSGRSGTGKSTVLSIYPIIVMETSDQNGMPSKCLCRASSCRPPAMAFQAPCTINCCKVFPVYSSCACFQCQAATIRSRQATSFGQSLRTED